MSSGTDWSAASSTHIRGMTPSSREAGRHGHPALVRPAADHRDRAEASRRAVTIEINNETDADVDEALLSDLARFVLGRLRIHPAAELAVLLVDPETMSHLHERWMDEPGPTDVLSFPMDEIRPPSNG